MDQDIVYTIKERVKLTDSTTGQSYDVEMNLKVQIPFSKNNSINNHNMVKKSNSLPFVESLKKSVLCPMMPWRCRGGDQKSEDAEASLGKSSNEVGRKIFQAADVITKSPQKSKSFEDLTTTINNNVGL